MRERLSISIIASLGIAVPLAAQPELRHARGNLLNIETPRGIPLPPPLDCPYLDDLEWLDTGPVQGQTARWTVALTSGATVVDDGAQGHVIQQTNSFSSDDRFRREMATALRTATATTTNDLVATVEARTTGATVRGVALFKGPALVARVLLGRHDPNDPENPLFNNGVYVQINPDYQPIDSPFGGDPTVNVPVVGIDVLDTEHNWTTLAYRTIELRIAANGALRVSIDGQRVYTGPGAFMTTINTFAFESENNSFGPGSQLRINDVALVCDAPSCAADFDLDDEVTFADLNAVLSNFGASDLPSGGINPGDANADLAVDFADLNAVLSAFGTSCD